MTSARNPWGGDLVARAARLGQAAWLFGNLYEAAVGMPELLRFARAERPPGLRSVGSPVRYFAPIAPLAVGAGTLELLSAWRSPGDRVLVLTSGGGLAVAVGLSGYLISAVNIPLLGRGDLGHGESARLVTTWHRANSLRIAALAAAMGASWLRRRRTVPSGGSRGAGRR